MEGEAGMDQQGARQVISGTKNIHEDWCCIDPGTDETGDREGQGDTASEEAEEDRLRKGDTSGIPERGSLGPTLSFQSEEEKRLITERNEGYQRCKVAIIQSRENHPDPMQLNGRERLMWYALGSGVALVALAVGRLIKTAH